MDNRLAGEINDTFFARFVRKVNRYDRRCVNVTVTVTAMVFYLILLCFHELCCDEAQAWLIARYASYSDMLFYLPHYEGHIPFLYLIYSIPAKLGLPAKPVMTVLHLLSVFAAVYLIEFRSPFPNIVRIVLPFMYFFLHPALLARPYILLIATVFMAAVLYNRRDEMPVRYTLTLMLMCMTHLYGIVIAGGIALEWVIASGSRLFTSNRRRLLCLAVLAVFAAAVVSLIIPAKDIYLSSRDGSQSYPVTLIKFLIYIPSEVLFTNFISPGVSFQTSQISLFRTSVSFILSGLIWVSLIRYCAVRKRLAACLIPIATFSLVGAYYIFSYHFAFLFMLFVYSVWICSGAEKNGSAHRTSLSCRLINGAVSALIVLISSGWSMFAVFTEITSDYDAGKSVAEWIVENNLQNLRCLGAWDVTDGNFTSDEYVTNSINAYMGRPLCYNLVNDRPYIIWRCNTPEQSSEQIQKWAGMGTPDMIITGNGEDNLRAVTDELGIDNDYVLVYCRAGRAFYKTTYEKFGDFVWLRKDLADTLGITPELSDYNEIYGVT